VNQAQKAGEPGDSSLPRSVLWGFRGEQWPLPGATGWAGETQTGSSATASASVLTGRSPSQRISARKRNTATRTLVSYLDRGDQSRGRSVSVRV